MRKGVNFKKSCGTPVFNSNYNNVVTYQYNYRLF